MLLLLSCGGLAACGSSDSGDGSDSPAARSPVTAPAESPAEAQPKAPESASPAAPSAVETSPTAEHQKQQLMDLLVWGDGDARDKQADGSSCGSEVENDPVARKSIHGLVGLQRWIQCMEKLGWKRKT